MRVCVHLLHTEDIAIERENSHFRRPHSHDTTSLANPDEYRHKPYIARNHRPWVRPTIFAADSIAYRPSYYMRISV